MNESEAAVRRRGGREARRVLRAAPIPEAERAVRAGMEGAPARQLVRPRVKLKTTPFASAFCGAMKEAISPLAKRRRQWPTACTTNAS